jgi:nickel/cobalt exporter
VGPGHGKTIISSYVVANEETVRRGVIISFSSPQVSRR